MKVVFHLDGEMIYTFLDENLLEIKKVSQYAQGVNKIAVLLKDGYHESLAERLKEGDRNIYEFIANSKYEVLKQALTLPPEKQKWLRKSIKATRNIYVTFNDVVISNDVMANGASVLKNIFEGEEYPLDKFLTIDENYNRQAKGVLLGLLYQDTRDLKKIQSLMPKISMERLVEDLRTIGGVERALDRILSKIDNELL
ncbi:MAG: hypothetical protein GXP45_06390 [bacterium]|nr:hypothetical protein [bacterium]